MPASDCRRYPQCFIKLLIAQESIMYQTSLSQNISTSMYRARSNKIHQTRSHRSRRVPGLLRRTTNAHAARSSQATGTWTKSEWRKKMKTVASILEDCNELLVEDRIEEGDRRGICDREDCLGRARSLPDVLPKKNCMLGKKEVLKRETCCRLGWRQRLIGVYCR